MPARDARRKDLVSLFNHWTYRTEFGEEIPLAQEDGNEAPRVKPIRFSFDLESPMDKAISALNEASDLSTQDYKAVTEYLFS